MEEYKGMDGRTSGKVVSMRGWQEARRLQETLSDGIFYQSLVAQEARTKEQDPRHFEIIYTVSAEEFLENESPVEYEEEEVFSALMDGDKGELIPLNRQVIERYELYDLNSEDIHVIYRIPFHPLDHNFF